MAMQTFARVTAAGFAALLSVGSVSGAADQPSGQTRFKSPPEAMKALVAAARTDDRAKLIAILGPDAEAIVSSGDAVEDAQDRRRFVAEAAAGARFETLPTGTVSARVRRQGTPLPSRVGKEGDGGRSDTAAGKDELLNRRIGRNELMAISAAHAYVDAQEEYAREDPMKSGGKVYAQRFRSESGQNNGLYWDDPDGKHPSPLGPLVADASAEGYTLGTPTGSPEPFHGYYYRILTAQGQNAPGGVQDYVKDGKMTGGFALVAWPAEYGQSGIMTFLVNRQGIVFQKNLGPQTAEAVKGITTYDPDASWAPTR